MTERVIRTVGLVIAGAVATALVVPVFAANPLSSADVSARFGTGQPIKGTLIPGGASYELTLAQDGMATMKVLNGDRTTRTGTWRVSKTGYCAQWGSAGERCYTIVRNGKAFDVIDPTGKVVARWTT